VVDLLIAETAKGIEMPPLSLKPPQG
jgi:hypothetical protein